MQGPLRPLAIKDVLEQKYQKVASHLNINNMNVKVCGRVYFIENARPFQEAPSAFSFLVVSCISLELN